MANKSSYVMSGIFMAAGLAVLIAGSFLIYRGMSTYSWTPVEGIIIGSEGYPSKENPGEIGRVDIEYRYEAEDSLYKSERIGFHLDDPLPAAQLLQDYPEGQIVMVLYNPEKAKESVLIPGISLSSFLLPLFGLLFASFGVGLLLWELKTRKKEISLTDRINRARKEYRNNPQFRGGNNFQEEFSYSKNIVNTGGAVLVVILGLFIIIFPVTVILLWGAPEDMKALFIVGGVCALLGIGLILSVLNVKFSKISISFRGESVKYVKKSLFRTSGFEEKIQNYVFITPREDKVKSQFSGKNTGESFLNICAVLIHQKSSKKDIEIRLDTQPYNKLWSDDLVSYRVDPFAEKLSLPVETFSS